MRPVLVYVVPDDGFFFNCRSYGDSVHCRKALHRAVQCTSDYPEHVCEVLLTFERVEGKEMNFELDMTQ